jgi:hypothetical protein
MVKLKSFEILTPSDSNRGKVRWEANRNALGDGDLLPKDHLPLSNLLKKLRIADIATIANYEAMQSLTPNRVPKLSLGTRKNGRAGRDQSPDLPFAPGLGRMNS